MTALTWDEPSQKVYEYGVEKGVLYSAKTRPTFWFRDYPIDWDWGYAAWPGLISVSESDENTDVFSRFYEGRKVFNQRSSRGSFECSVTALNIPDRFAYILGNVEPRSGLTLTGQPRSEFHFSYKTKVNEDDFKIHMVYNASIVPTALGTRTINSAIEPTEFSWQITTVPPRVPYNLQDLGASAHFVWDSRKVPAWFMTTLENLLYGSELAPPWFPPQWIILNLVGSGIPDELPG